MRNYFLCPFPDSFLSQILFLGCVSEEEVSKQIDLRVQLLVGHAARHVDREAWDHEQVAVDVDEHALYARFGAHDGAARERKRAVEPRGEDHAAVALCIELFVMPLDRDLRAGLDAEGRGIAVRGDDLHAVEALRHRERDQCGAVAQHEVALSRLKPPRPAFRKPRTAGGLQHAGEVFGGVEARGAFVDELKQFFCRFVCSLHLDFPFRKGVIRTSKG